MAGHRIAHAGPREIPNGQAGLLSGPVDLRGICLRRIRAHFRRHRRRNGTGFLRSFENKARAFRRRAMLLVSAKRRHRCDAGIGQIFHQRHPGTRGDFAQAVHDEAALNSYIREVSRYYDAILMQPLVSGDEYRIFLLDDEVLYAACKHPPALLGDGVRSIRELLIEHNSSLTARGLSSATIGAGREQSLDRVLQEGERWEIPGRMNLSAGGKMVLAAAPSEAVSTVAREAARALGLRVAAVDLFTDISGEGDATAVIEVNSNPSIRLLEESGRADLILKIWHHTFSAMGLLGV